jgi:hypothetical protein
VVPALLEGGHDDDDRLAVAAAGGALLSILRALGSAGLTAKDLEGVAQMATDILKGEAFCQVSAARQGSLIKNFPYWLLWVWPYLCTACKQACKELKAASMVDAEIQSMHECVAPYCERKDGR